MKLQKIRARPRCSYVTQPGDLLIDFYDGKPCTDWGQIYCASVMEPGHDEWFCYLHWSNHQDHEHKT